MSNNVKQHKVSSHLEKVLSVLIEEKLSNGDNKALVEHLKNTGGTYLPRMKCPTYETLRNLLDALNISNKQFFEQANIIPTATVGWATPVQKEMADLVDAMTTVQRSVFLGSVKALISDQVSQVLHENENNPAYGQRITNVLKKAKHEGYDMLRIYTDLGISSKWLQKEHEVVKYVSVPFEYMPAISNETGVSLHWLSGWDRPVLAKYAETETVMDYFCFLPEDLQNTLLQAIVTAVKTGGVVLG